MQSKGQNAGDIEAYIVYIALKYGLLEYKGLEWQTCLCV